jgi:hypothetical protein
MVCHNNQPMMIEYEAIVFTRYHVDLFGYKILISYNFTKM